MLSDGLDKALVEQLQQHFNIMEEEHMGKGNKPTGGKKDKLSKKPKKDKVTY